MISGLDLNATVDYTLKNDKDNPTVFKIGVIPSYMFARMTTEASGNEIEAAYKLLQVTIKGWDNFSVPYETEKQKVFGEEQDVVPMSVLGKIPLDAVNELSVKALEVNQISDDERKN